MRYHFKRKSLYLLMPSFKTAANQNLLRATVLTFIPIPTSHLLTPWLRLHSKDTESRKLGIPAVTFLCAPPTAHLWHQNDTCNAACTTCSRWQGDICVCVCGVTESNPHQPLALQVYSKTPSRPANPPKGLILGWRTCTTGMLNSPGDKKYPVTLTCFLKG